MQIICRNTLLYAIIFFIFNKYENYVWYVLINMRFYSDAVLVRFNLLEIYSARITSIIFRPCSDIRI